MCCWKGRIPPDSPFFLNTLVSIRETRWEWMDIGGLCHQAVACACPHLLHIPLCWPAPASADHSLLVPKSHRLLFLSSTHACLTLEHLSLWPIFQGSAHTHFLCGVSFSDISTALTILTAWCLQLLARLIVVCVYHSLSHCELQKSQGCVQFTPNPSSTPHRSCHLRWFFPSAKILIPDFLITLVPLSPMCTHRMWLQGQEIWGFHFLHARTTALSQELNEETGRFPCNLSIWSEHFHGNQEQPMKL